MPFFLQNEVKAVIIFKYFDLNFIFKKFNGKI